MLSIIYPYLPIRIYLYFIPPPLQQSFDPFGDELLLRKIGPPLVTSSEVREVGLFAFGRHYVMQTVPECYLSAVT